MISDMLALVDNAIFGYVLGIFNSLNPLVVDAWRAMFTLFVIFYGYRMLFQAEANMNDMIVNTIKAVLVLIIATTYGNFAFLFFNVFTAIPNEISGLILSGSGATGLDGTANSSVTVNQALSDFWDQGMSAADAVQEGAKLTKFGLYLYAGCIAGVTIWLTGAALILIILAKLGVAVLLAVGPLFLLFLLFPTTRGYFEGWLRALTNFALIPIFTYALLALVLRILVGPVEDLVANSAPNSEGFFAHLTAFILAVAVGSVLLAQIPGWVTGISGGVSLQSTTFGRGVSDTLVRDGTRKGVASASKRGGQAARGTGRAGMAAARGSGRLAMRGARALRNRFSS